MGVWDHAFAPRVDQKALAPSVWGDGRLSPEELR